MIAEVLLSGIHSNEAVAEILKGREGYRLVDDFFIGFDDEESARRCRDTLRRTLWEYNLHLNEGKTRIERSSTFFADSWKHDVENFEVPERNAQKQRNAVQRLMEISLQYCSMRNDPVPASFFCQRLTNIAILDENFPFVRDCLLRVARDFAGCLKSVVKFVTQFRYHFKDENAAQVMRRWLGQIFAAHTHRGHDMEIANALVICGIIGMPVTKSFVGFKGCEASPVPLAILGLLGEDGLLDEPWDNWKLEATATPANGRYWLPYYEAVYRKWTRDIRLIEAFSEDDFFMSLAEADVSFLDSSDFNSRAVQPPPRQMTGRRSHVVTPSPVSSGRRRSAADAYD